MGCTKYSNVIIFLCVLLSDKLTVVEGELALKNRQNTKYDKCKIWKHEYFKQTLKCENSVKILKYPLNLTGSTPTLLHFILKLHIK